MNLQGKLTAVRKAEMIFMLSEFPATAYVCANGNDAAIGHRPLHLTILSLDQANRFYGRK